MKTENTHMKLRKASFVTFLQQRATGEKNPDAGAQCLMRSAFPALPTTSTWHFTGERGGGGASAGAGDVMCYQSKVESENQVVSCRGQHLIPKYQYTWKGDLCGTGEVTSSCRSTCAPAWRQRWVVRRVLWVHHSPGSLW